MGARAKGHSSVSQPAPPVRAPTHHRAPQVNPAGFELGVLPMPLSEAARARLSALAGCPAPPSLVMQYVHGDVVSSLPPGVHSMGGTSLSPNNGFVAPGALCFQGHPEFSSAIVQDIILRLVERGTVPQRLPAGVTLEGVRNSLYSPVDSHFVAAALVGHLLGE